MNAKRRKEIDQAIALLEQAKRHARERPRPDNEGNPTDDDQRQKKITITAQGERLGVQSRTR